MNARRTLVVVGAWLAFGLLAGFQNHLYAALSGRRAPWSTALALPVITAVAWALWTPGIAAFARRVPLSNRAMLRSIALHLAAIVVLSATIAGFAVVVLRATGLASRYPLPPFRLFQGLAVGRLQDTLLTYAAVLGILYVLDSQRRLRERERAAAQLEARLAEARLAALRAQLQPHFLFNTLHAISTLMHRDVAAADRMMARLSDLLRLTLDRSESAEVSLEDELELVERYLGIEQVRFADRLSVRFSIEPDTLVASVPNLLLQPLVENAIRHAVAPRAGASSIEVRAWRADGRLELRITDDGPGLPAHGATTGVGLANTRARLAARYGADHRLDLLPGLNGAGLAVTISIPFRPVDTAAGGAGERP